MMVIKSAIPTKRYITLTCSQLKELTSRRIKCLNNIISCHIKLKQFREVIKCAKELFLYHPYSSSYNGEIPQYQIQEEPPILDKQFLSDSYFKTNFNAGKVEVEQLQEDREFAMQCLRECQKIVPDDLEVKNYLEKAKKVYKQITLTKNTFQNLFQRMDKEEYKEKVLQRMKEMEEEKEKDDVF